MLHRTAEQRVAFAGLSKEVAVARFDAKAEQFRRWRDPAQGVRREGFGCVRRGGGVSWCVGRKQIGTLRLLKHDAWVDSSVRASSSACRWRLFARD